MKRRALVATLLAGAAISLSGVVRGQTSQMEPEGVISVSPAMEGSCLAVRLALRKTQALAGVKWYNNDGAVTFTRLVAAEVAEGGGPQMDGGLTVAGEVAGSSSEWSEVVFSQPVATTGTAVDVIFELGDGSELTDRGVGGGAGFGYRRLKGGPAAFVSADGRDWVPLLPNCWVLVEPVLVTRDAETVMLGPSVKAKDAESISWATALLAPRPNPGNPGMTIAFTLAKDTNVELVIYDLRGRQVATLLRAPLTAGQHDIFWQGRDGTGRPVSSGVYFARLKAGKEACSRRLVLIR